MKNLKKQIEKKTENLNIIDAQQDADFWNKNKTQIFINE